MKINLRNGIFLLFGIFLASFALCNPVVAGFPSATGIGVKIDTPADSANLPIGDLTIYGTSSDSNTTDCQVYADWNDLKPMQNVIANGPKGSSDYSKWSFTYTSSYHTIAEGDNELTSKITCYDGQNTSSKSYSINVTGMGGTNEITNNTVQKSSEVINTKDVANEDTSILPANSNTNNTDITDNLVKSVNDVSNEDTGSEDTKVLSIDNNENKGTYKILPLYSESDEESTLSASSEDSGQTGITNMNTIGSQDGISSTETIDTSSGTFNTFSSDQKGTSDTKNTDMTSNEASDEGFNSKGQSNTFFTYEPDLIEDASNQNGVNTLVTSSDTARSLTNHKLDESTIFGLKFNGFDDLAQNKIENRVEKLQDRTTDSISLFDLVG